VKQKGKGKKKKKGDHQKAGEPAWSEKRNRRSGAEREGMGEKQMKIERGRERRQRESEMS
jgi:hypothetical protein